PCKQEKQKLFPICPYAQQTTIASSTTSKFEFTAGSNWTNPKLEKNERKIYKPLGNTFCRWEL
ncbi:hypothetical protein NPN18_25920, partial [Vibrio parahaemolyticus]|nr:hypothetical protein [Vibrio parahaemolyticus]